MLCQKVKIQLFQNMNIKLNRMEHRASCKHIFSPCTYSQPVGWFKRLKNLNAVMLHIKLSGKKYRLT